MEKETIFLLFIHHQGVYGTETCVTTHGTHMECETGCCGNRWEDNIQCCMFHPTPFVLLVLALVITISIIALCLSKFVCVKRGKVRVQPERYILNENTPSVTYVVVPSNRDPCLHSKERLWHYGYPIAKPEPVVETHGKRISISSRGLTNTR